MMLESGVKHYKIHQFIVTTGVILYHSILTFEDLKEKAVGEIVGKGENAGNWHFVLFP